MKVTQMRSSKTGGSLAGVLAESSTSQIHYVPELGGMRNRILLSCNFWYESCCMDGLRWEITSLYLQNIRLP